MVREKVQHFEERLDLQRQMAEQDMAEAVSQIELLRKMLDEAEGKLKMSKPIVATGDVYAQTEYVAFYPTSATFCEEKSSEENPEKKPTSLEQHISEALEVAQSRKIQIGAEGDRLTTVTEFSQYVETRTNNSPDKPQPVLKLLSDSKSNLEEEKVGCESNSELREFKINEMKAEGLTEIQGMTQTFD